MGPQPLATVCKVAIRRMFHAMVTNDHSPRTDCRPRSKNWRKPITLLRMPNTGSTVCLRKACQARPARVCNRGFMRVTGSVGKGNGGGSLKRACQDR